MSGARDDKDRLEMERLALEVEQLQREQGFFGRHARSAVFMAATVVGIVVAGQAFLTA